MIIFAFYILNTFALYMQCWNIGKGERERQREDFENKSHFPISLFLDFTLFILFLSFFFQIQGREQHTVCPGSLPSYSNLRCKIGHYFLDIQYSSLECAPVFEHWNRKFLTLNLFFVYLPVRRYLNLFQTQ